MKKRIIFVLVLAAVIVLACSSAFAECLLKDYAARLMDPDDHVSYYLASLEYGMLEPTDQYKPDFAPILLEAKLTPLNESLIPDGEYYVLGFPQDGIRFDFFRGNPNMNYIRQINPDYTEELFSITMPDDILISSSEMMANELQVLAGILGQRTSQIVTLEYLVLDSGFYFWFADQMMLYIDQNDSEGNYTVYILSNGPSADSALVWCFSCRLDSDMNVMKAFHVVCSESDNSLPDSAEKIIYDRECSTAFFLNDNLDIEILNSDDERLEGITLSLN